jgi:hypothetical protein
MTTILRIFSGFENLQGRNKEPFPVPSVTLQSEQQGGNQKKRGFVSIPDNELMHCLKSKASYNRNPAWKKNLGNLWRKYG